MSKPVSGLSEYKNTSGAKLHQDLVQKLSVKTKSTNLVSKDRLRHSTVGDYIYDEKDQKWIMTGGGHSQEAIDFMFKNNIGHKVNIEYENGVRVGNVFNHTNKQKRENNGQSWFPKDWDTNKIKHAGEKVALKYINQGKNKGKFFDIINGVRVGVILEEGKVMTIFPDSKNQGATKR